MPTILSLLKEQHVYYVYCSISKVCIMYNIHQNSITKLVTVIIYVLATEKYSQSPLSHVGRLTFIV